MMKGPMYCISVLKKPQCANDSVMEEDGNIYHYRDSRLVGITLPNARTRFQQNSSQ